MPIFVVHVAIDMVVEAADPVLAQQVALEELHENDIDFFDSQCIAGPLERLSQLPAGWDGGCRPWGTIDDEPLSKVLAA